MYSKMVKSVSRQYMLQFPRQNITTWMPIKWTMPLRVACLPRFKSNGRKTIEPGVSIYLNLMLRNECVLRYHIALSANYTIQRRSAIQHCRPVNGGPEPVRLMGFRDG